MELLTSLDWLERPPMVEEIETIEDEDNIEPQVSEILVKTNDAFLTFVDKRWLATLKDNYYISYKKLYKKPDNVIYVYIF